jgi:hypothetical protein
VSAILTTLFTGGFEASTHNGIFMPLCTSSQHSLPSALGQASTAFNPVLHFGCAFTSVIICHTRSCDAGISVAMVVT